MAQRLVVVAHGRRAACARPSSATPATCWTRQRSRRSALGSFGGSRARRVACVETAARLGGPGKAIAQLGSCDFGSWTGRSLADVGASDPMGIRHWLADPHAKPHGGESLSELILRVGVAIDQSGWPEGRASWSSLRWSPGLSPSTPSALRRKQSSGSMCPAWPGEGLQKRGLVAAEIRAGSRPLAGTAVGAATLELSSAVITTAAAVQAREATDAG